MNTKDLYNRKVRIRKPKKKDPDNTGKLGRIRAFVFHPRRARLVGYLVKRPDLALMFRRDDVFVSVDGFEEDDGALVLKESGGKHGKDAEKALAKQGETRIDDCILWIGLPVMTEGGKVLGMAENVEFDPETGDVIHVELSLGATANTLLGRRLVPASMIRGFKRGKGVPLAVGGASVDIGEDARDGLAGGSSDDSTEAEGREPDPQMLGALVVSDDAVEIEVEGGVAEKAGAASAVAADKAKKTYRKVTAKAGEVAKRTEPGRKKAAKAAGDAVQKGAFETGKQIARAGGMFSEFGREFMKALDGDDDAGDPGSEAGNKKHGGRDE